MTQAEAESNLSQASYSIGQGVVHKRGQQGTIVAIPGLNNNSQDYRVTTRPDPVTWKRVDLVQPEQAKFGAFVIRLDGSGSGNVLSVTGDEITVLPPLTFRNWQPADIEGTVEEVIRQQVANEYQLLLDDLRKELDALKEEIENESAIHLLDMQTVQNGAGELKVCPVEVKTVVQRIFKRQIAGGDYKTKDADDELAALYNEGWEEIPCLSNPLMDRSRGEPGFYRFVTLRRLGPLEAVAVPPQQGEEKATPIAPAEETFVVAADVKIAPANGDTERVIEVKEPEESPAVNSFRDALRGGRFSAQEMSSIGDQQAYNRAKAVYDGYEKTRYAQHDLLVAEFRPRVEPDAPLIIEMEVS
jgi:hypothetical protein